VTRPRRPFTWSVNGSASGVRERESPSWGRFLAILSWLLLSSKQSGPIASWLTR
jgi:hypothetical protein